MCVYIKYKYYTCILYIFIYHLCILTYNILIQINKASLAHCLPADRCFPSGLHLIQQLFGGFLITANTLKSLPAPGSFFLLLPRCFIPVSANSRSLFDGVCLLIKLLSVCPNVPCGSWGGDNLSPFSTG